MASSTSRYRFEFRLRDWAAALATSLCGQNCSFFVGFRDDGTVRRVYLSPPGVLLDAGQKAALLESYAHWFLYVPYEDDGSAYLEWLGLPETVAVRWLGRAFVEADFLDVRSTGQRDGWPQSWRVLVG